MELVDEYGVEELERYIEEIFAYADLRTAEDIRRMPSGTYVGETWIDTDGQGHADSYIRASVTIADDTVHVDFSGSAEVCVGKDLLDIARDDPHTGVLGLDHHPRSGPRFLLRHL